MEACFDMYILILDTTLAMIASTSTCMPLPQLPPLPPRAHLHTLALARQVGLVILREPQRLAIARHHRARVPAVRSVQLVACSRAKGQAVLRRKQRWRCALRRVPQCLLLACRICG